VQAANISKYWMDKFLVEWGTFDSFIGIPEYTHKAYLKVEVITDISSTKVEAINQSVAISLK
jgi:formylglycine-generating enzyme required for sulfatase activity